MDEQLEKRFQQLRNRIVIAMLNEDGRFTRKKLIKEVAKIENKIDKLELCMHVEDEGYEEFENEINNLRQAVRKIKHDNFIYDEELELDIMFSDRHKPGFDEDQMSVDSVFGWY